MTSDTTRSLNNDNMIAASERKEKSVFYKVCAHMLLSGFQHLEHTEYLFINREWEWVRESDEGGGIKDTTAGIAVIFDGRTHHPLYIIRV